MCGEEDLRSEVEIDSWDKSMHVIGYFDAGHVPPLADWP
jgi:hypothetical protein